MDSFEIMLTAIFLLILFAVSPQGRDILRGLNSNSRIVKSSTNAGNNVRITNDYNGVTYKPISVLQIQDDEFSLEVETVERPHRRTTLPSILTSQLKHDPIDVLSDGVIHYRLTKREMLNENYGIDDEVTCDPTLTKEELQKVSASQFKEITELKGEISNQKATVQEQVRDVIDNTAKLQQSKFGGDN